MSRTGDTRGYSYRGGASPFLNQSNSNQLNSTQQMGIIAVIARKCTSLIVQICGSSQRKWSVWSKNRQLMNTYAVTLQTYGRPLFLKKVGEGWERWVCCTEGHSIPATFD